MFKSLFSYEHKTAKSENEANIIAQGERASSRVLLGIPTLRGRSDTEDMRWNKNGI